MRRDDQSRQARYTMHPLHSYDNTLMYYTWRRAVIPRGIATSATGAGVDHGCPVPDRHKKIQEYGTVISPQCAFNTIKSTPTGSITISIQLDGVATQSPPKEIHHLKNHLHRKHV
ncbi:MAG TPA: hypothetical protein ACQGQH_10115 [Xylella sp.]